MYEVQWGVYYSYYVPPAFTFRSYIFCLRGVFTCFVCFSEETAFISIDSINLSILMCVSRSVYSEHLNILGINLLTPNVNYSGRTAPLTSKVAFYIFIQQI